MYSNRGNLKYLRELWKIIAPFYLIVINVFIYIVMYISGADIDSFTNEKLLKWGVNYKLLTTNGEWWRLFTSIFIHKEFLHLAFNMYGLLIISILTHHYISRINYVLIYVISGVVSNVVCMSWQESSISFGSTSSILGLLGVMFTACLANAYPVQNFKNLIILSSLFLLSNIVISFEGNYLIANTGGFVTGCILGIFLTKQIRKETQFEQQFSVK